MNYSMYFVYELPIICTSMSNAPRMLALNLFLSCLIFAIWLYWGNVLTLQVKFAIICFMRTATASNDNCTSCHSLTGEVSFPLCCHSLYWICENSLRMNNNLYYKIYVDFLLIMQRISGNWYKRMQNKCIYLRRARVTYICFVLSTTSDWNTSLRKLRNIGPSLYIDAWPLGNTRSCKLRCADCLIRNDSEISNTGFQILGSLYSLRANRLGKGMDIPPSCNTVIMISKIKYSYKTIFWI